MTDASPLRQAAASFIAELRGSQYLGGWREGTSGRTLSNTNPVDGSELVVLSQASREDVDEAYRLAAEAQVEWAQRTPGQRAVVLSRAAEILRRRRPELEALLRVESGSSKIKAATEVSLATAITREASTFPARMHGLVQESVSPGKENRTYREPLGVVGVISPWNFPLHLSQRSVAPALAVGNAVVLKPASDTPLSGGLAIARIFEEAGLPAGVLSVVSGAGSEIGDHFVEHPVPAAISFTGSTPVGQRVGQLAVGGARMKKLSLELGGNAPLVVLDDADVDLAVEAAAMSSFLHQGQICMAANRIIVDASVHDEFLEKFVARVSTIPCGDVADDTVVVGPVINDSQAAGIVEKIEGARTAGAVESLSGKIEGRLITPHIFSGVTMDMAIAREEIFGPVIGVLRAQDEREALTMANDTEFGLSSAVYTRDVERGVTFARGIRAGMTSINDITVVDEPHVMFGGEKNSGLGRFNGEHSIDAFTTLHWVGVRRAGHRAPF